MTVFYQNTSLRIDLNKIKASINYLKKQLMKIKEKALSLRIRMNEYEKEVKIITDTMEEIADLLEESPLFKDKEFYDFLMIQHMIKYILKDVEFFVNYSEFIDELIFEFRELVNKKIKLEFGEEKINYHEEYLKFKDFLFDKKEYFYLEIHKPHGKYNDLVVEITNIPRSD